MAAWRSPQDHDEIIEHWREKLAESRNRYDKAKAKVTEMECLAKLRAGGQGPWLARAGRGMAGPERTRCRHPAGSAALSRSMSLFSIGSR